jgi:PhoH-like ATPase
VLQKESGMIRKKVKEKDAAQSKQAVYVLDTNILVHDPKALYAFKGARVIIPLNVLEELDRFKSEGTDRGRSARKTIRSLDSLREHGSLKEGVELDNEGIVQVLFPEPAYDQMLENEGLPPSVDNLILMMALSLQKQGNRVTFISKDLNARVKADCFGIATEDYIKDSVSTEDFYHGWTRIQTGAIELKTEIPHILKEYAEQLAINEFVLLESKSNPYNNRIFRYLGGKNFKSVTSPRLQWSLAPRNPQQLMAMDLLMDTSIEFVCLFGPAGTGKTFLALLAGLHQVLLQREYERMLISRPVVPLGRDIGYLPGTLEEKLYTWMLPIYDNVEFIAHAAKVEEHIEAITSENLAEKSDHRRRHKKNHKKNKQQAHEKSSSLSLHDLIKRNKVSLEAITYMRGRSIPFQFILIDEAQNLTPHEIKTLVTRVGEGSKIVLAGDPYQIDSLYLDFPSNGLVYASERFKGQPIFGSVYLEASERSPLSDLASTLL